MSQPTMFWNGEIVEPTYLGLANATERTAPRVGDVIRSRDVLRPGQHAVDRTALVALLDAWQAWEEARYAPTDVEGPAYWEHQRSVAFDAFYEAMSAFAEAVDL